MPESRSKYSDTAVARRKKTVRNVLLSVLIVIAVAFVVMAGRYIYGKSKDPNYRLADLFHSTKSASFPTLPINTLPDVILPSSEPLTNAETESVTSSEEETPEESSSEEIPETTEETDTEAPETTPEDFRETSTEAEDTETSSEDEDESSSEDETAGETETTEEETTEETTVEETTTLSAAEIDPTDIGYHLLRSGFTENDLSGCTQLIAVQSNGTQCMLYFFEKGQEGWAVTEAIPAAPGIVGRNGVTDTKTEGDGCTPSGYYALGPCYGEDAASLTKMEYHQILEGDYWVDDSSSEFYNQLIRDDDPSLAGSWKSGENLFALLPYYRYMAVIRYNTDPAIPGAGSAIFLHCQNNDTTTSGCVATKEATMFAIFRWLDPAANPHILIY